VSFPLFAKLNVNPPEQHPLYSVLSGKEAAFPGPIEWNFGKFLVGRDGKVLHRFSPAFSRDTARRVYVQDRLRAEGAELWRWLDEGARIYCCGATAMESAVREALVTIARDHGGLSADGAPAFVETLRADGRYLRDTY
jgi:sulfite reductase alpha subunit-like flavoprotein